MIGRIVIINDFSAARGGATGLALLSARLFRAAGIPVTYFTGDTGNNPLFNNIGAKIIALGEQPFSERGRLRGAFKGIYNKTAQDRLWDWIHHNDQPDTVYHVHGWSKIFSPQIFSALRPVATRTFIHAHDFFLVCPNGAQFHYGRAEPCTLKPLSAACLMSNCDKRRYSDKVWRSARQATLNHILNFDPGFRKILLPHEKMIPYFTRAGMPQEHLQTLRNPVTPFSATRVLVENNRFAYFIGRLAAEKGIHDAIHAARIAQVPLKVIGDGPLREELARTFPDVEFLGWRFPDDISDIIQNARIVVMPTRYPEPFGLVALEAARSGVPVIVSDTAFLAEEFAHNGIGFSCNTRDHRQFAEQLRRLAHMPIADLADLSRRAAERSAGCAPAPENWRDTLLACYNQALSEKTLPAYAQ